MDDFLKDYETLRNGGLGFHKQRRGLFEVSGGEAVQFLNGLITNDIAKLEDGAQMLAAFPTVKGRMFAVARVRRIGEKFLFETEEATRQKVFDNLFRFTFAGDFQLTDLSGNYEFFSFFGDLKDKPISTEGVINFDSDYFVPNDAVTEFRKSLSDSIEISDELYETLRIETGIPKYGVDMDEETVVPEVNLNGMISYHKGCYIGQEVIARIHFRGKVAKQLIGLVLESNADGGNPRVMEGAGRDLIGAELKSINGKSAGFITSVTLSPKLGKTLALAYVRNAFLEAGTELNSGEFSMKVADLPLIQRLFER